MTLNIEDIKNLSRVLKSTDKLKFNIKHLKIRVKNEWKSFKTSTNESFKTPTHLEIRGHRFGKIPLTYVLLDTGNLTDYLSLGVHFLGQFKKELKHIRIEWRSKLTYRNEEITTLVSVEEFEFKLFDSRFISKIGFACQIDYWSLMEINIGINVIRQILNIIIPGEDCYYYHCRNH